MTDPRLKEIRALLPRAMLRDWLRLGSRLVRLLKDHHHAARHDAVLARLIDEARASIALRERRAARIPAVHYPSELPISSRKDEVVAAIRKHPVVVVAGETGSGKTTQIPKMCLEAGLGIEARIGCTQPRRIAALAVSRRLAEELNVEWGGEVGCKIRFSEASSPETYIKVMTDGILLAETQGDPLLAEYNALIIDEAHERSLNIDFLLGYIKNLLGRRPDLKLVITSATINTQAFSEAFGRAPIIEVSGRMYPVEVHYRPLGEEQENSEELDYIDAAVATAEGFTRENTRGDILIFMPGEKDIRETSDTLRTRLGSASEIIPLYGRLTAAEQQRVFAPAARRKIIISTNIAETSLTIPGIHCVIDTGLARMSRYSPRTRTRRLPIEEISQSSANQRKGRSGRVSNGVCIRLYSEKEFMARPVYTQPEIQRANLAEVILRMKAFKLGEIESFPFLDPPAAGAIHAGYSLLQELGALDSARNLTALGGQMARLPIDPSIARMLLQSHHERATRELLIIGAGLSIQDPRERPLDQKAAAATAHEAFADLRSDFLTLLNIWNAVHEKWEHLGTQNQRRKFCRANFLSYVRMREWQDLHAQLEETLEDVAEVNVNDTNASYDSIHRCILSGLLGHVARRQDRNTYITAGKRQVTLFPGSTLYDRREKEKPGSGRNKPVEPGRKELKSRNQPEWIVAGEIVETSNVFARTAAGINPEWILELAPHLCQTSHENPHWDAGAGQVLAVESTTFNGLEIRRRRVAYGNINAAEATEIFIRSALVEEASTAGEKGEEEVVWKSRPRGGRAAEHAREYSLTRVEAKPRYQFLEHNRKLREKIETWRTRTRHHALPDLDQAFYDFYAQHLQNVSSFAELDRCLREPGKQQALMASEGQLVPDLSLSFDQGAFPDHVNIEGREVPVAYAYRPGDEQDGVTLRVPATLARDLVPAVVEWAVPGLREPQAAELLRSLPKSIRKQLMPLQQKAEEIARELRPGDRSLQEELSLFVRGKYGVDVPPSCWSPENMPAHLRPRIEVVGGDQRTVLASRDLTKLKQHLSASAVKPEKESGAWNRAAEKWERFGLTSWTIGDVPERLPVGHNEHGTVLAWPGLELEREHVNLKLFHTASAAQRATVRGFRRLVEAGLSKDLLWLHKDLRALGRLEPLYQGWLTTEEIQTGAFDNLRGHAVEKADATTLTEAAYNKAVRDSREALSGKAPILADRLEVILQLRQQLVRKIHHPIANSPKKGATVLSNLQQLSAPAARPQPAQPLACELEQLLPKTFLEQIPFERLGELPRFLKALLVRAERAAVNPAKDREKAARLEPYVRALVKIQSKAAQSEEARAAADEFRWMLEEYKISVFAQELGTAFPVSAKRLDEFLTKTADRLVL